MVIGHRMSVGCTMAVDHTMALLQSCYGLIYSHDWLYITSAIKPIVSQAWIGKKRLIFPRWSAVRERVEWGALSREEEQAGVVAGGEGLLTPHSYSSPGVGG